MDETLFQLDLVDRCQELGGVAAHPGFSAGLASRLVIRGKPLESYTVGELIREVRAYRIQYCRIHGAVVSL